MPVMGSDMSGRVPQVTTGASVLTAMATSASNLAPSSLRS